MKLQEMREKTVEELKNAVVDFKKQLLDLRVQKATNKLENTALIAKTKHYISQIKTVIKEEKPDWFDKEFETKKTSEDELKELEELYDAIR